VSDQPTAGHFQPAPYPSSAEPSMPPQTLPPSSGSPTSTTAAPKKKRGGRRKVKASDNRPVEQPLKKPREPARKPRRAAPAKRPRTNPVRRPKRPKGLDATQLAAYADIFSGLQPGDGALFQAVAAILQDANPAARQRVLAVLPKVFA